MGTEWRLRVPEWMEAFDLRPGESEGEHTAAER